LKRCSRSLKPTQPIKIIKKRLAHVDPLKLGITLGIVYGIISLVVIVPLFLIVSIAGVATAARTSGQAFPAIFSGVFLIFMPIIYVVIGFIGGVIAAFIYNLVAKWTGGIEFTTQEIQ
jgi:Transmembrane domain of unknown function (DUF3566)